MRITRLHFDFAHCRFWINIFFSLHTNQLINGIQSFSVPCHRKYCSWHNSVDYHVHNCFDNILRNWDQPGKYSVCKVFRLSNDHFVLWCRNCLFCSSADISLISCVWAHAPIQNKFSFIKTFSLFLTCPFQYNSSHKIELGGV